MRYIYTGLPWISQRQQVEKKQSALVSYYPIKQMGKKCDVTITKFLYLLKKKERDLGERNKTEHLQNTNK